MAASSNRKEAPAEPFKRALGLTVRAIAGDGEVQVGYAAGKPELDGKSVTLPEPSRFNPDAPLLTRADLEAYRSAGKPYPLYIVAAEGGGLVLRDYKTGKAPIDSDASLFKGGRQLQIPFYILAAEEIFPGEKVVEAFLDYVNAGRQVAFNPLKATSATFKALLLRIADLMGQGVFMQEPSACTFCDFTAVCGPTAVLESRKRRRRLHDPLARRVVELKDFA